MDISLGTPILLFLNFIFMCVCGVCESVHMYVEMYIYVCVYVEAID